MNQSTFMILCRLLCSILSTLRFTDFLIWIPRACLFTSDLTGERRKFLTFRNWFTALSLVKSNTNIIGRHKRIKRVLTERSEEHTSELQSLMRISYAVFCLKKKKNTRRQKKRN